MKVDILKNKLFVHDLNTKIMKNHDFNTNFLFLLLLFLLLDGYLLIFLIMFVD